MVGLSELVRAVGKVTVEGFVEGCSGRGLTLTRPELIAGGRSESGVTPT